MAHNPGSSLSNLMHVRTHSEIHSTCILNRADRAFLQASLPSDLSSLPAGSPHKAAVALKVSRIKRAPKGQGTGPPRSDAGVGLGMLRGVGDFI